MKNGDIRNALQNKHFQAIKISFLLDFLQRGKFRIFLSLLFNEIKLKMSKSNILDVKQAFPGCKIWFLQSRQIHRDFSKRLTYDFS